MAKKKAKWPSRILWMGIGAALQLSVTTVLVLVLVRKPDVISAWGSVLTAIATLGLVGTAVWAGRVAVRTLDASRRASEAALKANEQAEVANGAMEKANAQAEQDSKNVNRPYIAASLVPGLAGLGCFDLALHNYGRAAAWDLTVTLDRALDVSDEITDSVVELLKTPRTIFPGQTPRAMWSIEAQPGSKLTPGDSGIGGSGTRAGMPPEALLHLAYHHEGYGQTATEESIPIFDAIVVRTSKSGLWPAPDDGTEVRGTEPSWSNIYALGRAISRNIGNLGR